MADEQKIRISNYQEGHKGTSAAAPAIATTAKAVSAVPAPSNAGGTASNASK